MTASRADVQAKLDAAVSELKQTSTTGQTMVSKSGPNPALWPNGHWHTAMSELSAARSEVGELVDPTAPPAPLPPPPLDPVAQPEPPAFTATRTLPDATTWAEFQSALASLQPGDRVNARGVTFPPEAILAKHVAGAAELVIDSSCKIPGGKAGAPAIWVEDCANLRLVSNGAVVSNPVRQGIQIGGASDCVIDGFLVKGCGAAGMGANPTNAMIKNVYVRAEIEDWGLTPTVDNHPEKGTGLHGLLVESSKTAYGVDGLTVVLTSKGSRVGGSLLEVGSDVSTNAPNNVTAWLHGENLLGQTVQADGSLGECKIQTAGNVLNAYGYVSGLRVLWLYAKGCHGYAVHSYPYNNGSVYNVAIDAGHAESCCLNPRYAGQNPWQQNHAKYPNTAALTPAP